MPPEVTWPPPFDCTGARVGACRLFDELEELEEFEELESSEELDESEELVPESSERPVLVLAPELPELAELPEVVAVWCVEPGSAAATAPAATTLARPTVAVVAFSLRLPRSRSATARARVMSRPCSGWPYEGESRSSQLFMTLSFAREVGNVVGLASQQAMTFECRHPPGIIMR